MMRRQGENLGTMSPQWMVVMVSDRESGQHKATVSDRDISNWMMPDSRQHHLHAGHHLAEGTVEGASRPAFRADAKAVLVDEFAEWDEESRSRLTSVLVPPLQVRHQLLGALFSALSHVLLAAERFLGVALVRHVAEGRSNVRRPHRAHAQGKELLCAAQASPQTYVDAAQTTAADSKLKEHLGRHLGRWRT